MQNELIIAIGSGLVGMFGWGLADFFAKKTIDQIGDTMTLAWGHIFGTLVLFLALLFQNRINHQNFLPNDFNVWLPLIFFGVLQAIVYLLVYRGFGKGQVGILSPVFSSFSGITALLSIFFLGEVITGSSSMGLVVVFIGILLINLDFSALKSKKIQLSRIPGIKEVGLATILAAFWTLGWKEFISGKDWLLYAFFMYAFMTIAILLFVMFKQLNLLLVNKKSVWHFLILIGACEIIAYLGISYGYSATSHTSIIALLSGAFSLPTIVLAKIFLKEKLTAVHTMGALVIIVGVMILSIV